MTAAAKCCRCSVSHRRFGDGFRAPGLGCLRARNLRHQGRTLTRRRVCSCDAARPPLRTIRRLSRRLSSALLCRLWAGHSSTLPVSRGLCCWVGGARPCPGPVGALPLAFEACEECGCLSSWRECGAAAMGRFISARCYRVLQSTARSGCVGQACLLAPVSIALGSLLVCNKLDAVERTATQRYPWSGQLQHCWSRFTPVGSSWVASGVWRDPSARYKFRNPRWQPA